MEHGGLLNELAVDAQLRVAVADEQAAVGDLPRVLQKQSPQVVVLWIVFVDD